MLAEKGLIKRQAKDLRYFIPWTVLEVEQRKLVLNNYRQRASNQRLEEIWIRNGNLFLSWDSDTFSNPWLHPDLS